RAAIFPLRSSRRYARKWRTSCSISSSCRTRSGSTRWRPPRTSLRRTPAAIRSRRRGAIAASTTSSEAKSRHAPPSGRALLPQPDPAPDLPHERRGDIPRPARALLQDLLDFAGVCEQFIVARAHGGQFGLDHLEQLLLGLAPGQAFLE